MNHIIDLQIAIDEPLAISAETLISWAKYPLINHEKQTELTLRIVDEEEMHYLNKTYRNQDKTTNVLAFPANLPPSIELDYTLLGDVIVCPNVLLQESIEQNKPIDFHWAHIIIHGVLHLLGYDHIEKNDEEIMKTLEIQLLADLGFTNPYHIKEKHFE